MLQILFEKCEYLKCENLNICQKGQLLEKMFFFLFQIINLMGRCEKNIEETRSRSQAGIVI